MSDLTMQGLLDKIDEWEREMAKRDPIAVEFRGTHGTLARVIHEIPEVREESGSPLGLTGVRLVEDDQVPDGCLDCIDRHGKAFKRIDVYRARIRGAMPEGEG